MEELAVFVFVAIILAMLALTFVVWLRQDTEARHDAMCGEMRRMENRMNDRFALLEERLAAVEHDRAKSEGLREAIAGRAATQ